MRTTITLLFILLLYSCSGPTKNEAPVKVQEEITANKGQDSFDKIQILNLGTFHMGYTTDANKTDFDERNKKNQEAVHQIAKKLSKFNPTVILVEMIPERNNELQQSYSSYRENPSKIFENPTEIELLAFELGRLSHTERIYGIDHKLGYNYMIGAEIENSIDSTWHNKYYSNPTKYHPNMENAQKIEDDLAEKLQGINQETFLDFLITVNADMLTHAGSIDGFEGADEAAKYYQRNLRMYSNMNRITLDENDRVFILMGASHTAFFRDFIKRSPKYEMVNTFDFL